MTNIKLRKSLKNKGKRKCVPNFLVIVYKLCTEKWKFEILFNLFSTQLMNKIEKLVNTDSHELNMNIVYSKCLKIASINYLFYFTDVLLDII